MAAGDNDGDDPDRIQAGRSLPALRKWIGAHNNATVDSMSWRASSPEALIRFMEAGNQAGPGPELGSETRFVSPSVRVPSVQVGSSASADWLLQQQLRRNDVLDKFLAAQLGK